MIWTDVCLANRDYGLAICLEFSSWAKAIPVALPPAGEGSG